MQKTSAICGNYHKAKKKLHQQWNTKRKTGFEGKNNNPSPILTVSPLHRFTCNHHSLTNCTKTPHTTEKNNNNSCPDVPSSPLPFHPLGMSIFRPVTSFPNCMRAICWIIVEYFWECGVIDASVIAHMKPLVVSDVHTPTHTHKHTQMCTHT